MTIDGEILATGDLGPARATPMSIFKHVTARLQASDCVLGQLEPVLSDRGSPLPQARLAMRSSPRTAQAISAAGFDVISFASNHCMDFGAEALLDTCAHLRDADVTVIGAGDNLARARRAEIRTIGATRIAVLARNSILPMGYWAEPNRAGCAPMRAWTMQEQIEHDHPGTPSRVHSFAHRDDLRMLAFDIEAARSQAHVVILSMHWGIHFVPDVIADYQREIAHTAIDAGADLVIGHHPHIVKGIEVYRGKCIFYSLGNFAIDPPTAFDDKLRERHTHRELLALNPNWVERDGHVVLGDSAIALVARCEVGSQGIDRVCALPVYINAKSEPAFIAAGDRRFAQVEEFLRRATYTQGLSGQFQRSGPELLIATGS